MIRHEYRGNALGRSGTLWASGFVGDAWMTAHATFRRAVLLALLFAWVIGSWSPCLAADREPASPNIVFSCDAGNDVYRVMTAGGAKYKRCDSAAEAVRQAPRGAGVLIMADGYPAKRTAVAPAVYEAARKKQLRLYVEYPSFVPGVQWQGPRKPHWERTVVASDAFGPRLEKLRILAIHDCHFLETRAERVHLVSARVAGYDKAVYGLPDQTYPILFEHPRGDILVATTGLSRFVTARYAPSEAWGAVWEMILRWADPNAGPVDLQWTPTVRPTYARDTKLPPDAERRALDRGFRWFEGFLVDESWAKLLPRMKQVEYGFIDPEGRKERPVGDGRCGILEGHISKIYCDGSQPMRWLLRGDCNAESAMAFALSAMLDHDARHRKIATNLFDFVYFDSGLFCDDPRSDAYGLLGWFTRTETAPYGIDAFWGNDGSKAIIGTIVGASALRSDRWDERLLANILGNFRTTGPLGFRDGNPLHRDELRKRGWRYFARRRTIAAWPQREAWAWACYLWLYDKTKYAPLLEQPRKALRLTMERYPDRWAYALNECQMERGRILLPLAWLVRVDDTPEHRRWLHRIVDDMLARQDSSGAIQEQVRRATHRSNAQYGTGEVSIIHDNDDPCADVFYSMAPALVGLVEAAAATGDEKFARAADRVAEFLVRVQVRSQAHPRLDGGWFRAFDFKRWDYWGGDGDSGWGAWSTETGWLQSHVVAAMAARQAGRSLWEMTADSKIAAHFEEYRKRMQIDEAVSLWKDATTPRCKHLALGKSPRLAHGPHPKRNQGGPKALTDGLLAACTTTDVGWLGFRGVDLEATIDLGKPTPIRKVAVRCLRELRSGIVLPRQLEVSVSDDGKTFRAIGARDIDDPFGPRKARKASVEEIGLDLPATVARHVRVRAKTVGKLPKWHGARGAPAWMFVDEIVVR